ncbi:MAG: flagellar hook-basal body complex protein [Clostridia bacterium]|nr:flagellar hook-basal body complex protein [Clostridia bacterium]
MLASMYSAVSGLQAHQTKMNVIGNNIANVNTYGFKKSRATFADVFYQTLQGSSAATQTTGGTNSNQLGYGASVNTIDVLHTTAGSSTTDRAMDVYINGEGYLAVKDANGTVNYTRVGILSFDASGNLVDGNGNYVLCFRLDDETGQPQLNADGTTSVQNLTKVTIPVEDLDKYTSISIGSSGEITAIKEGNQQFTVGQTSWIDSAAELDEDCTLTGSVNITEISNVKTTFTATAAASMKLPANVTSITGTSGGDTLNVNGDLNFTYAVKDVTAATKEMFSLTYKDLDGNDKTLSADTLTLGSTTNPSDPAENPDSVTLTYKVPDRELDENGDVTYTDFTVEIEFGGVTSFTNSKSKDETKGIAYIESTTTAENLANMDMKGDVTVAYNVDSTITAKDASDFKLQFTKLDGTSPAPLTAASVTLDNDTTPTVATLTFNVPTTDGGTAPYTVEITLVSATAMDGNSGSIKVGEAKRTYALDGTNYASVKTNIGTNEVSSMDITISTFNKAGETLEATATWTDSASDLSQLTFEPVQTGTTTTTGGTSGKLTLNVDNETMATTITKKGLKKMIDSIGNISTGDGTPTKLAHLALATFTNDGGLTECGENYYQPGNNSGTAVIKTPGTGGTGNLRAGALEMSNVDLAYEFTEMIICQRGFQANTKMITVSDQILEELVNMKR